MIRRCLVKTGTNCVEVVEVFDLRAPVQDIDCRAYGTGRAASLDRFDTRENLTMNACLS